MEYHVAKNWFRSKYRNTTKSFLTINKAASIAMPGDIVIVHEGIYREWVKPKNKGLSNKRRIIYQAADGEKVVIKGSEHIQSWQHVEGNIWKCKLPNSFWRF